MSKGKSKLLKSGPGTWGKLAGRSGTAAGQGVNVNAKDYRKSGQTGAAPSLKADFNPMHTPASNYGFKGV